MFYWSKVYVINGDLSGVIIEPAQLSGIWSVLRKQLIASTESLILDVGVCYKYTSVRPGLNNTISRKKLRFR